MESGDETIRKMILKYQELAIQQSDATEDPLNYKKANRISDKIWRLFDKFREDDITAEAILTSSLNSEDVRVRVWAASHCLKLQKHIKEALGILEKASDIEDMRILSFNAEQTIKAWKRQGYL